MSVDADLATLRRRITNYASVSQDHEGFAALAGVEAELSRLREERDAALDREAGVSDAFDAMKADRDEYDAILGRKMAERDAAEARCAELEGWKAISVDRLRDINLLSADIEMLSARCTRLQQALEQISETANWYARNDARLQHEVDHCLCVEIPSIADEALAGLGSEQSSLTESGPAGLPDTPADSPLLGRHVSSTNQTFPKTAHSRPAIPCEHGLHWGTCPECQRIIADSQPEEPT